MRQNLQRYRRDKNIQRSLRGKAARPIPLEFLDIKLPPRWDRS
jgi:hypothetical protein